MKRLYLLFKALICFLALAIAKPAFAQRALTDVTALQLSDLPKLTNGAQGWADYDGDKLPDLLITGKTNSGNFLTRLYHNTGKGFEDKSSLLPNLPQLANSSVNWGDYDDDRKPDLFIQGNNGNGFVTKIYHNTGNGFAEVTVTGDAIPGLAYGTINLVNAGDLYMYILVTGNTGSEAFSGLFSCEYQGLPANTVRLTNKTTFLPGLPMLQHSAVTCTDFNKDGSDDFVITGDDGNNSISKLYLSSSRGYADLTGSIEQLPQVNLGALTAADYNSDGLPDFVMTGNANGVPVSKLYKNLGTAGWSNFEPVTTAIAPVKRAKVAWADYDQDGRPDVLVSGIAADGSNFGKLYHNTSTGFQDVSNLLGLAKPYADGMVAWGDVDADGWPDLWYCGIYDPSGTPDVNRSFKLLKNNKNGTFTDISSVITDKNGSNTASLPIAYGSASFIDYKGDGGGQSLMMTGQLIDAENGNDPFSQMYYYYNEYNSKGKMDNTMAKVGGINPYAYWFPLAPDEIPYIQDGTTAWADYNNDSHPDLLYLGRTIPAKNVDKSKTPHYHTYLFKNNDGDTKQYMTDVTSIFPSNFPQLGYAAADWGDFNKDGFLDIIMCGNDGTKSYTVLYQNNGGNNFSDVSNLLPNLPQLAYGSVQWGDYDNDGRPDLIISGKDDSGNGITKLYHNTGSGFTDISSLLPDLPGVFTSAVNWIDYDNDGLLDLYITGDSQNGPVGILYHNKGLASTFTDQSALLPHLPQVVNGSVAFGDYDNDGRPDLYITGEALSNNASVLYHNTSSGFEASPLLLGDTAVSNSSAAWVDYDNDSWNDLMVFGDGISSPVTKLLHNVSPNVSSLIPNLPNVDYGTAAWGDYDNDGRMDIMLTGEVGLGGGNNVLFHNTGNGFENKTSLLPALPDYGFNNAAWADYDNDGKLDLVVSGWAIVGLHTPTLYHNLGTGFENTSSLLPNLPGGEFKMVSWADYDKDGKQDLLIVAGVDTKLYHNTGSGFEDLSVLLPTIPGEFFPTYCQIAWNDYDQDGYPDLVIISGNAGSPTANLYHNNKGAGFTDATSILQGFSISQYNYGAAWADYNHDGKPDLFINGQLFQNTGSGFTQTTNLLPGIANLQINSVNWFDYDNDGLTDLLLTTQTGTILYHNLNGGFESFLLVSNDINTMASVGDYDNDGRLDILFLGSNSMLFHNLVPKTNTVPGTPLSLSKQFSADGKSVTLSWQAASDAETQSEGLHYNVYVGDTPGSQNIVGAHADTKTGIRLVPQAGNSQGSSFTLTGLVPGKTYYWSVQAIDPGFAGSDFAEEQSFTTATVPSNPDIVWGKISAENEGRRNRIEWSTKHEERGDWFVVEKLSWNGSYIAIDKQYAKGRPSSYTAYDWQPVPGKNSYRIKIYNRDGSYKTSETVSVYIGKNDDCELKAFPNPVHRFVTITLDCDNNKAGWKNWSPWQGQGRGGLLSVINARGQTVLQVRMTDNQIRLDLSRFSDGLYYVRYDDGHDTKTIKIIKQ